MKYFIYYALFTMLLTFCCFSSADMSVDPSNLIEGRNAFTPLLDDSVRVVSYNLLFEKSVPVEDERKWENRIKTIEKYVSKMDCDIIGTQEALTFQINDLLKSLKGYKKLGLDLGGHTNDSRAENAALFYKTDKLEVLESGDFWYSKTPNVPGSNSWNSGYPRKCTWAKFKVKTTGTVFFVFNSHFYVFEEGHEAKTQCAIILEAKIKELAGEYPVICTGDFNSTPGSATLALLLNNQLLKDSRALSPKVSGPEGTFHGFSDQATVRLDYVLVNEKVDVLNYRVLDDELVDGQFGSDHLPVVVDLVISSK
ncbi:endonuclease/exonuclease/phosphatase family protein [Massilibacteroides sp.]|uniref:endonuclease/exonuclease/phosphatase family protein n=1 Tax=Massilibacteroides sp. TaxID=2034766 RepID=UPI00260DFF67|nr:endonuclease/exonuclease/phosphatase family protein [Massilibacteroides sp.]MDD4515337.1 endonuclease/exonuclease/phosphatase family protein [Massilibacteroides sp.]